MRDENRFMFFLLCRYFIAASKHIVRKPIPQTKRYVFVRILTDLYGGWSVDSVSVLPRTHPYIVHVGIFALGRVSRSCLSFISHLFRVRSARKHLSSLQHGLFLLIIAQIRRKDKSRGEKCRKKAETVFASVSADFPFFISSSPCGRRSSWRNGGRRSRTRAPCRRRTGASA